jgi:hypothetical protein
LRPAPSSPPHFPTLYSAVRFAPAEIVVALLGEHGRCNKPACPLVEGLIQSQTDGGICADLQRGLQLPVEAVDSGAAELRPDVEGRLAVIGLRELQTKLYEIRPP